MSRRLVVATVFALAWGLAALSSSSAAQGTDGGGEQERLLLVRRRQIELREARAQLNRTKELVGNGLVPRTELERVEGTVERAQLDYQEALLALFSLQPRVSVKDAVKFQTADGRKSVRLTVTNLSPTFDDSQFRLLNNFDGADPIPSELRTRDVRDLFISLKDPGSAASKSDAPPRGTAIALPYEVHLADLPYGRSRTLEFELLRDIDSVVVATSYKGQQHEIDIQLQQAETVNVVTITSTQVSQEADLGQQATFDLRIERSTVDARSFQLKVLDLPRAVSYSFLDPTSQARLSQINFPAGVTQVPLSLRLYLPERSDEQVRVDRPLDLWAVAMSAEQAGRFSAERAYSPEEIRAARVGALRCELIPRGVGRIEVSAPSLFSEVVRGDSLAASLTVRNTGSRRLDNVQLTTEPPVNWRVEMKPRVISSLDLKQEQAVHLRVFPPGDVAVGDYEIRLKTESYADNRRVPSEDKIFRVSVTGKSSVWTTLSLLGGLLSLVVGVVFVGARLAGR